MERILYFFHNFNILAHYGFAAVHFRQKYCI